MRFDHWARWRESVLFWLLLDPVEVARLCLCPPTVNTETLSKVYTKNKLASATSKLPDSTRLFMHPVHSPIWLFLAATALQGYFWFLCPAFSFFSQHNFTEKPAHQKFLTSSSFVCVCVVVFSVSDLSLATYPPSDDSSLTSNRQSYPEAFCVGSGGD